MTSAFRCISDLGRLCLWCSKCALAIRAVWAFALLVIGSLHSSTIEHKWSSKSRSLVNSNALSFLQWNDACAQLASPIPYLHCLPLHSGLVILAYLLPIFQLIQKLDPGLRMLSLNKSWCALFSNPFQKIQHGLCKWIPFLWNNKTIVLSFPNSFSQMTYKRGVSSTPGMATGCSCTPSSILAASFCHETFRDPLP